MKQVFVFGSMVINNLGDYEPSNCKWATRKEQANNTRLTSRK